jgi:aminopeptidase N
VVTGIRTRAGAVIVSLIAVSCGGPGVVEVERADVVVDGSSTTPGTSSPGTSVPVSSTPSTPDEEDGRRQPELGLGDDLFPDLGSSDVDVVSYDVRLDVSDDYGVLEGEVTIVARVPADVSGLALDSLGLQIIDVTVDGEPASTVETGADLVVSLPADHGRETTVIIDYRAEPDPRVSASGLPVGWFSDEQGAYVLNEPDGARSWLPSNDHPSDKASWRFEILAPEGAVVSANGELIERGDADDPWVWVESDPMPTYLVHLVIGDYELIDRTVPTSDGDLALTHLVPAGRQVEFEAALESIGPQLVLFEELFGPYPLTKYGLAFADSPPGLAMETQGRSLLSEHDFGDSAGLNSEVILAHELAHQWFGNAVTPAAWEDIWLSESFATYAQWLWFDHIDRRPLESSAASALGQRQRPGSPTGDPAVNDMFAFTSYDGGAAVIHALRSTIGDDAFFELLGRWVADYSGTSQTSEAFVDLAEEIHGEDLTEFFDDWLYATSLPEAYPS